MDSVEQTNNRDTRKPLDKVDGAAAALSDPLGPGRLPSTYSRHFRLHLHTFRSLDQPDEEEGERHPDGEEEQGEVEEEENEVEVEKCEVEEEECEVKEEEGEVEVEEDEVEDETDSMSELAEWCRLAEVPAPLYDREAVGVEGGGTSITMFCLAGGVKETGRGRGRAQALQRAAGKVLTKLGDGRAAQQEEVREVVEVTLPAEIREEEGQGDLIPAERDEEESEPWGRPSGWPSPLGRLADQLYGNQQEVERVLEGQDAPDGVEARRPERPPFGLQEVVRAFSARRNLEKICRWGPPHPPRPV
jgi:hypothetical protein